MSIAINEYKDIDGICEMYTKLKSVIPPGLVNLMLMELAFLLLAGYIGLCMWTGLPATGMEFVVVLVLFLTVSHSKK